MTLRSRMGAETSTSILPSGSMSSITANGTCTDALAPTGNNRMGLPSRVRVRQISSTLELPALR